LWNQATSNQLKYIRDLGGNPPEGITKDDASELIQQLLARNGPTPRQMMILRFWGRMEMAESSKDEVSEWMSQFYTEDPRRKLAWEKFKIENGDDGLQRDPSWVPVGIGGTYLSKAGRVSQTSNLYRQGSGSQKSGCTTCIAAVFLVIVIISVTLKFFKD
jgi:hypothetical protein